MLHVRVVLVRPENHSNIGASARAIMNMGLGGLDLVDPGDFRTIETWRTAWRAEEILEQARVFPDLATAVADCVYVAGFVSRSGMIVEPITVREMAGDFESLESNSRVALVFGCESHGLSEVELRQCQRRVYIPSHQRQPSLNLAQAVMVAGYEIFLATGTGPVSKPRAPYQIVQTSLDKLEDAFVDLGFLTKESAPTRFSEWREMFGRAGLTTRESRIIMALARKIKNIGRIVKGSKTL